MVEIRWYRTRDDVAGGCKARLQYRYRMFEETFVHGAGGYGEWSDWQYAVEASEPDDIKQER